MSHRKKRKSPSAADNGRSSWRWAWLLAAGAAAVLIGVATKDVWWPRASRNFLTSVSAQEIARGAGLFRDHCQACHGESAQGENPASAMGGLKPGGGYLAPALNARGHAHHHPPDVLFGYLRNGSPAADSPMRSFKDKLSEADMRAVLGYVYSLWPDDLKQAYNHSHQ